MRVLGIETSCDETGLAIYDSQKGLIGDELHSQIAVHAEYGGVVPELASRDHIKKLRPLLSSLLKKTQYSLTDIDGIAFTSGPGLVGALLTGACFARSLAWALNKPAIGIHHMEGHLLAPMLSEQPPEFPFLALLVSGGHTQILKVEAIGKYELLGETLDDAAGEAFDKASKMMNLPYPGGPALSSLAKKGDELKFKFARPMTDRPGLDMSFSGLKTQVRTCILEHCVDDKLDEQTKADISASFQLAMAETLSIKCKRALKQTGFKRLIVSGGVGANTCLRENLKSMAQKERAQVFFPPLKYCTDNGAMIAYAGCMRLQAGETSDLSINVRPRWPLSELNPIGKNHG